MGRAELTDAATTAAFRLGWSLVQRMPERLAYRTFDAAADLSYRRGGKSVDRLRGNYARVRPELNETELEELVRAGMRSYLRYWCEAFRLPRYSAEQLRPRVRLEGDEEARAVLADGGSLVLFLGHMGNWDMCGAWATTYFAPVTTVAERLKPEEVFEEFLAFRESLGMRIIPLTGGVNAFPELIGAARQGAFIPLLADRDLTHRGVTVDLCGQQARVAAGPAAVSLESGAALFALGVHYEHDGSGGHRVVCRFGRRVQPQPGLAHDEQIKAMTQACADDLGAMIREHTEDWHMMQRVFVDDLDPRRT